MSDVNKLHRVVCPECDDEQLIEDFLARRQAERDHAARFRAGMAAMSRFMTWVWIEATSQLDGLRDRYGQQDRGLALVWAIGDGRLALRWNE
jgi:hypothetical protein